MGQGNLPVHAAPQADSSTQEIGVLTFIDNSVDATTGTIKLKGTFPNADNKLWPGEFVRVTLGLTTRPHATVVPNQAVQTGQDGQFVYVVKQDQTVEMRPVVTGTRVDQELVIDRGLQPGETVVTEGQLRLTPGSHVQVQDGREARHRGTAARQNQLRSHGLERIGNLHPPPHRHQFADGRHRAVWRGGLSRPGR